MPSPRHDGRGRYQPTYHVAMRFVRLLLFLGAHPQGCRAGTCATYLRVSTRTLYRYLEVCERELRDEYGAALIEHHGRGASAYLRLRTAAKYPLPLPAEVYDGAA